jgi:hypothetical protein
MRFFILIILTLNIASATAQQSDTTINPKHLANYLASVSKKYQGLDASIEKNVTRTINRLRKQERRLAHKLTKKDSAAGKRLAQNAEKYYDALEAKAKPGQQGKELKEYIPAFDTAKTTMRFLSNSLSPADPLIQKVNESKAKLQLFEEQMQAANELKKQLKERKQQLVNQLEHYGMVKDLKKLNKEIYYYQQQLGEYKALIKDPKKMEQKALAILRENSAFKAFIKKNSMLAKLFKLPDDYGSPASLAGLQTQASVQAMLTQRMAGAGVNPQQYMQDQMKEAEAEMNKLKKRLRDLTPTPLQGRGASSSDISADGFKPNTQKTKSFLQRLEYGMNFQTQKVNSYFPTTTDVALTLGYKLNDKSVIGIGASYKMGLGNIQHIKLTHEGVGVRSYVDWKLKGSFWITGGYEQNYLQRFSDFRTISDVSVWRQSALLGITKKVNVGKKSSKLQLLYDFFHKKDNIPTQPLIFRIEYALK